MRCGIAGSYETYFTIWRTFYRDQMSVYSYSYSYPYSYSYCCRAHRISWNIYKSDFSGLYTSLITHPYISVNKTQSNFCTCCWLGWARWMSRGERSWLKQMYSVRIWLLNVIACHIITYIGLFGFFLFSQYGGPNNLFCKFHMFYTSVLQPTCITQDARLLLKQFFFS